MNHYKFKAIFSPRLENKIIEEIDIDNCVLEIREIIGILKQYSNMILFLIPIELKQYFFLGNLRIILSEIGNSPQSNIIFYRNNMKCNAQVEINGNALTYRYSINALLDILKKAEFPLFIDKTKLAVYKSKCSNIECKIFCCYPELMYESEPFSKTNLENINMFLINKNYDNNIFSYKEITSDNINDLFYIICKFHNIEISLYHNLNNLIFLKEFFDDISDANIYEKKDILFSILRGIIFPSSRESTRVRYSIDIHKNNPPSVKGYNLYRIDVVNAKMSGLRHSGKLRVLIGKKNKQIYVIAFTRIHDFSKSQVYDRLI